MFITAMLEPKKLASFLIPICVLTVGVLAGVSCKVVLTIDCCELAQIRPILSGRPECGAQGPCCDQEVPNPVKHFRLADSGVRGDTDLVLQSCDCKFDRYICQNRLCQYSYTYTATLHPSVPGSAHPCTG